MVIEIIVVIEVVVIVVIEEVICDFSTERQESFRLWSFLFVPYFKLSKYAFLSFVS